MAPPSYPPMANGRLIILYASQTGNAMDVAQRVGREAKCRGCLDTDILSMDTFNPNCLPDKGFVVFIVSTMGQGDPPDSMKSFWKYLLQKHLGSQWLQGLQYAVFGLGDSGYQKYNIMRHYATDEEEKERFVKYLASPKGREDRTVLEVLKDFPSVQMPFEWLVQLTPPLKKRAFSISSSPLAHPNQIHLTVSIVSWGPSERRRRGLCSTWLAGLGPKKDTLIPCWIRQGSLPRPLPSTPLLLIGPGTGCAPFRAFVEERAAQAVTEPTAPVLFFFGCRNENGYYLYKDFWSDHAQNHKVLSSEKGGGFCVAFSRDQPKKIYVQDKIKEESETVANLLCSSKAAIYIVGCSTKMPDDVTAALEVLCKETGDSKENVSKWLKDMKRAGRFIVEAWS